MDWWIKEFRYLLDRKILSRDELAYLFGQIKSVTIRENKQLHAELRELRNVQFSPSGDNHHNAAMCPHCGDPVRKLQAKLDKLKKVLGDAVSYIKGESKRTYLEILYDIDQALKEPNAHNKATKTT